MQNERQICISTPVYLKISFINLCEGKFVDRSNKSGRSLCDISLPRNLAVIFSEKSILYLPVGKQDCKKVSDKLAVDLYQHLRF